MFISFKDAIQPELDATEAKLISFPLSIDLAQTRMHNPVRVLYQMYCPSRAVFCHMLSFDRRFKGKLSHSSITSDGPISA
jgi:hypothetical protein